MAYEQIITVSGSASSGQIPQADGNGGYTWATPAAGVSPSSATPLMDGTAAVGTSADYARGDHRHPTDTSRAASSHAHGNITNAGAITATGVALANNDTLVFVDSSDSSKLKQTSIKFDGSTATKALTQKGTFETFLTSHQDISGLAPKASPEFSGTPTAPTATAGTNTTQLATTAFVTTAVANKSVPTATTTTPKMDGTAAVGSETKWAKGDHVHPTDTSRAPLASPAFTGTPTAPTAASGTANTQIATTEFVANALGNNSGILKVNCGTMSVLPTTINSSDITATMELVRAEIGTTDVQDGDWTVTTANGSVTISGSISGATTLVLYLSEVRTAS